MVAGMGLALSIGIVVAVFLGLDSWRKGRLADESASEAEKTQIASLLMPIGQKSFQLLDPIEREALVQLGNLPSERTRMRFLETALSEPATAQRIGLCTDWVIQASVGLNQKLRRDVTQLLTRRIQDPDAPRAVTMACIQLGLVLNVQDRAWTERTSHVLMGSLSSDNTQQTRSPVSSERALDLMMESMLNAQSGNTISFYSTNQLLAAVTERLDSTTALEKSSVLVTAMRDAKSAGIVASLEQGLVALTARLDTEGTSKLASQILDALRDSKNGPARQSLTRCFVMLSERQNDTSKREAIELLLADMKDASNPQMLISGVQNLMRFSTLLNVQQIEQTVKKLVDALSEPRNSYAAPQLALALMSLAPRLNPATVAAHADKAATVLLAKLDKDLQLFAYMGKQEGLVSRLFSTGRGRCG